MVLLDVTANIANTPPPRERRSPQATPQALRSSNAANVLREDVGSPTGTANIQRFSLRSRSARLRVNRRQGAASCRKLQLPGHLRRDGSEHVRICDCSADPCLGAGRRRLCKRATDEHDEFRLLELLNSRFVSDCRTGGELIASKASLREMDISFILEPVTDAVMGYAAVVHAFDHGIAPGSGGFSLSKELESSVVTEATLGKLPLLSQLYVEPQARKKGLATAALRVLLASRSAAVVESPSLATARAMLRLGFKPVGAQWMESGPRVLYVRLEALTSSTGPDENF